MSLYFSEINTHSLTAMQFYWGLFKLNPFRIFWWKDKSEVQRKLKYTFKKLAFLIVKL
jgi:hypothetical protein